MSDTAAIVTPLANARPPGHRWQPRISDEAVRLMAHKNLPAGAGEEIQRVAASIMARGQDPRGANGQTTGLVVGYVQSGKTLSFTTVTALARDNHIPIVVVVAGTNDNLFSQTIERLLDDLQVNAFAGPPRWLQIRNPDVGSSQLIRNTLDVWRDQAVPQNEKPTLLLTVMKQHQRLNHLNELLAMFDLRGVPAIVIDDEADQASLNTRVNRGEESTTYERLLSLRDRFPHHSYLQYTATPQAPLLINIIDSLSPDFVEVLEPGDGYVGGQEFFGGNRQLTRVIPVHEVPSADNPITEPPESLLESLRVFFIGVSAGRPTWGPNNPNRSMLVHPTRTTLEHFQYFQSIEAIKNEWVRILDLPGTDPDKRELLDDFLEAYRGVAETVGAAMPPFASIAARLRRDIADTQIREVNRRPGNRASDINWNQAYAWILVGGQKMDRGFTVKELTVTYMPRGIGTGNADTLQQRARFFGYKRNYLGFCRIYLESEALGAFESYVAHEEEMREELIGLQERGEALSSWKRRFVLSDDLNPCRTNVIQQQILRGNFADSWFFPHMLTMNEPILEANRQASAAFCNTLQFVRDRQFSQVAQQHDIAQDVSLDSLINEFLLQYRVEDPTDTENFLGLLLQVGQALKRNPRERAVVYRMRPDYEGSTRTVNGQGKITSIGALQQGPTRRGGGAGGYTYPGDREFMQSENVSVQIHMLDLTETRGGPVIARNVPAIAVWIPERMSLDWIVQDQAART